MWAQSSHTFSDVSLQLPGPLADSPRFVAGDHNPGDQHPSADQSSPSLAIHHAVVSVRVLFAGSPSGHCLDGGLWSEPPQEWAWPKTPRINSHREEVCGVSFYTFPFRTAPPPFATAGVGWGAFLLTHHTL